MWLSPQKDSQVFEYIEEHVNKANKMLKNAVLLQWYSPCDAMQFSSIIEWFLLDTTHEFAPFDSPLLFSFVAK